MVTIRRPLDGGLLIVMSPLANVWSHNRYIARSIRRDCVYLMQFVFNYFVDLIEDDDLIQEEAIFAIHVEQPREMTESTESTEYVTDSDVEMVTD